MDRRALVVFVTRLAAAWLATTLAVLWGGVAALLAAWPLLRGIVEIMLPDFIVGAAADPAGDGGLLLTLQAIRPVHIAGDYRVVPWVPMHKGIHAGHDLVPLILLFSLLLAWPWRSWLQWLRALALGLPAAALLLVWSIPVHVAGLFEIDFQRVAAGFQLARPEPWYLTQMLYLESGGAWLAALLLGLAIVATSRCVVKCA